MASGLGWPLPLRGLGPDHTVDEPCLLGQSFGFLRATLIDGRVAAVCGSLGALASCRAASYVAFLSLGGCVDVLVDPHPNEWPDEGRLTWVGQPVWHDVRIKDLVAERHGERPITQTRGLATSPDLQHTGHQLKQQSTCDTLASGASLRKRCPY